MNSSAPRPRRGQTHRCRREDHWRHHYPDSAKESLRRAKSSRSARAARTAGKLIPIDLKVATVCCSANVGQTRSKLDGQTADHEGERIMGVLSLPVATEEGRVSASQIPTLRSRRSRRLEGMRPPI